MKILHLSSEYPPAKVYGLGRFVHGLARAQAAEGDEVSVLTNSHGGAEDDVVRDGVRLHRISFPNPPRPSDGHGEVLQFNHGLVARFFDRRERFQGVDVVASHDWLTAIAAREVARELGVPLVVTFHDEVTGKHFGLLDRESAFVRDLEALTAHDASHVVANSRFIAEQLVHHYGVPRARVTAIPGGIDPAVVEVARRHRVADFRAALAGPGDVLVAYVGRLDQEKGLPVLAEAALRAGEACEALRFVLAGSGREGDALGRALAPLGRRARLLGYLKGAPLSFLYQAADVVVVPSLYEPFGLVALEAMIAGTATVTSDAGGLAEIVRHEQDGLVVPAGDADALAQALVRLAHDTRLRRQLGEAARVRAASGFSWRAIARRTRTAYEAAIAAPRAVCAVPPAPPERPLVSVTLVTHNAPVHAETALRSVFARTDWPRLEAVVVENGSHATAVAHLEGVVDELRARGAAITLIRNAENRLFSAGQNQAIRAARGEYVCLLNDDTEVPPGSEAWLRGLVWTLETFGAATVTPVTLARDGRIYCAGAFSTGGHHLRDVPDAPGLLSAPRRTEWNNMACLLTRRRFFDEAGPLVEDGALAHYGSDREWGLRAREELGRAHWVHPARLFHFEKEAARDPGAPYRATPDTRLPASIVVVAYKNLALTRVAIDAVLAHTEPPFELVLVDNGSGDGTLEYFRSLRDALGGRVAVQLVENPENLGYPTAANQGLRAARGRDVVLLNNDTTVRSGWLAALLGARRSRPRVGIVTAKILCPDGRVQNAGGIHHHPDGGYTLPYAHEDRLAPTVSERRVVETAGGPCILLTREILLEAGVFDEAYSPAYFEDQDLCFRAREKGFVLLYEPGAEVVHLGKATASIVASEGKLDIWGRFEENKRLFYGRWGVRIAADEEARTAARRRQELTPRLRILLCANRPASGPGTPAGYLERALRERHDVVTAGRGQELDLGPGTSARALVEAAGGRVDLLLAVEGDDFLPDDLEDAPCRTAWWAIDNHLFAVRDGDKHLALAPAFDHVFCAQRDYVAAFEARGVAASWLPLACAPELHDLPGTARELDVVFVGHVLPIHRRRRALLDRLARGFRLVERQGVYGADMAKLLARAKVVFNVSLAGDLNMRVFEGLASGGLVLTDRIANGLDRLFADGEHLVLYDDEDLESVLERALSDDARRVEVAARGHALARAHHTYAARARELLRVAASGTPGRRRAREVVT